VPEIHIAIGVTIIAGFLALASWGLLAKILRREPGKWFWRLLAALQVVIGVQVVAGVILLLMGDRRPLLHYGYGALFPAFVLSYAHQTAKQTQRWRPWAVFAVAAAFCFGLTLRALMTGLAGG
jgi:hypothetical protein